VSTLTVHKNPAVLESSNIVRGGESESLREGQTSPYFY
jgi:hypothetical protein